MNSHQHLFGERPLHGIIAAVLFSVIAAFVIYAGMVARNVSNVRNDITVIGHQVGGAMVATGVVSGKSQPIDRPTVVRTSKSDKGVFYDAEAAGGIADAKIAPEDKNSSEHKLARLN